MNLWEMLKGNGKALSATGALKGDEEAIKDEEYTLKCDKEKLKGDTGALNNLKWGCKGIQRRWGGI